MGANLKVVPIAKPNKATHTSVDTILVNQAIIESWKAPPFQRPLKLNAKVIALAQTIKEDGGVIPGVLTIGVFDRQKWLLDGQHRAQAFLLSECPEGYADVRYRHFDEMADMGDEFVALNSQLVRLRPDDVMRGLEGNSEALQYIRKKCPWVGYDMIRRGANSPIIGMSQLLRCWYGSAPDTPVASTTSAAQLAKGFDLDNAKLLVSFLAVAMEAWGKDAEYARLWGSLNLILCMWLYRNVVLKQYSPRTPKLTPETFTRCLMHLSTEDRYLDWLMGRSVSERDRSPAYHRIKNIFVRRLAVETGKKPAFPTPSWAKHSGG